MVRIGVLALQGDVAEHRRALTAAGAETVAVRRPADLDEVDGLVLPGGESTTVSMLLASSGLAAPLAAAVRGAMPVLGTCAGMILLAAAAEDARPDQQLIGAIDIRVRRNGYGRQAQSFECELAVDGAGSSPVHAVFIRAPVVVHTGPDVEVLATLPDGFAPGGVGSPVLCRQGSVLVAAFHPELTSDLRIHRMFLSMVASGAGAGAGAAPPGVRGVPALAGTRVRGHPPSPGPAGVAAAG